MTIYYIDSSRADNTGNGLTPATAKKTYAGMTLAAGDTKLYMRGGTYTVSPAPTVAGTVNARIKIGAYANPDGSDNRALPRPIFNLTAVVNTYASTNKDYVDWSDLDVRAPSVTVAANAVMFYLGKTAVFRRMRVDTNVGCVASWNNSTVMIDNCDLNGVSHDASVDNHVITISADNTNIDNIQVQRNILTHKGGGGSNSHIVRAETNGASYNLTRLKIVDNIALPPNGAAKNPNIGTIGLRLARCPGVLVRGNVIKGVLSGVYVNGSGAVITGGKIEKNDFSDCYNFGIHLPGATRNFRILRNKCWYAGTNVGASYYGRGIEISSSGGDGQNGGHVIAFNSCCYALNYGGPNDNASEGVGIGLDDGTDSCNVYGNVMAFNEGNGMQHFGGNGTQTGGHVISGNYFESNCTASFKSRRTGGTALTAFNAHCSFAAHKGATSYVANNYFCGSTKVAITENSTSQANVVKANNIFENIAYPVCMPAGRGNAFHNVFHNSTVAVQRYSDITTDGNGVPTFPVLAYAGTNDYAFDPLLDTKLRPKANSPCIGAGIRFAGFFDRNGRPFNRVPSIGMFESYPATTGV